LWPWQETELMMLRLADIGIAMGTGTDVAIESAKITLVKGDLQGIVNKELSHAVMKILIKIFFAFFYNVLGIRLRQGFYILLVFYFHR
jgi:Cu2+-exporting ATPase